ncbi:unnamed protein product [Merluccius merluccius]
MQLLNKPFVIPYHHASPNVVTFTCPFPKRRIHVLWIDGPLQSAHSRITRKGQDLGDQERGIPREQTASITPQSPELTGR